MTDNNYYMAFEKKLKHLDTRIASTVELYINISVYMYIGGHWFEL